MKQRKSIFETNSSSCHSISLNPWIAGRDGNDFPEEGTIVITGGEFGWGWEAGNGSTMKANYFATEYKYDHEKLDRLKKVIEGYTGQPVEMSISEEDVYIDHQSIGTIVETLDSNDDEEIKNFVFNPDVWLYIGNDNSDYPEGYDDEEIRSVHEGKLYTVTIQIEGKIKRVLFSEYPDEDAIERKFRDHPLGGEYEIYSIDLPERTIVLMHYWKGTKVTGKITKITSDEYGDIL